MNINKYNEPYSHTREVFRDIMPTFDLIVYKTDLPDFRKNEIHENGEVTQDEFEIIKNAAEKDLFIYDIKKLLRIVTENTEDDYDILDAAYKGNNELAKQQYSKENLEKMIDNLKKIKEYND